MGTTSGLNQDDYASFSNRQLEALKGLGRLASFKKGDYIFRDRHDQGSIYILTKGRVSIYKLSDNGQQRTVFILDKGALLNEPISIDIAVSVNCEAFEVCEVLIIDKNIFFDMMSKDFEITTMVINQLSHKIRRMYRQLKNTADTAKIEKKVAAKLWKLCRDYGTKTDDGILISIDITTAGVADLMGARRETVSRAFRVLQDMGLIIHEKRKLFVPEPKNLSKFFKGM